LSQSITLGFDPNTGIKTSQTGLNYTTANPLKTSWLYDTFGRKKQETRPDGTYTVWTYNDCASNGGCPIGTHALAVTYQIFSTTNSVQNDGTTYLDTIDRPVVANAKTLSGGYDRNETRYDNLGRVHQQAMPCVWTSVPTLCPYWTTNTFDVLNRLTESQRPISATNSTLQTTIIGYAGRTTTVTDPQGKNTTKINLVTGSLGRTQDHTGYYINFKYDAFGSPLSVTDSLSNTLNTMTYDYGIQAFQRTSKDADLGPRSSTYDALGELTAYSDAKGQNFSILYDPLSRPTNRTEPDLTTVWTWGNSATSFNIGELQSATATSSAGTYSETYGYDSKARLSTDQITIPGDATYIYTRTYNATTGLLDTLQYPPVSTSGYQLKLQYAYQNGILNQISDIATGTHYWAANAINPRGQPTQETLGNNVVVNHSFDAVTGWVGSIQAGVGGGAALQNNSYLFDEVGNLTQRQDNNAGMTENVFPDNLYRLDHTVGDSSTAMSYDSMGRISGWGADGLLSNVKDYTTPQSGCTYYPDHAQPHAVRVNTNAGSSYSPASFCYDANGNMISATNPHGIASYSWTSYNQPNDISGFGNSSQLFYDGNHQRYKQIASYSGALETTYYVGGLLEKMANSSGTYYRHYIPAGSNTVVYTRQFAGTNSTYYITQDHLGSSAVITDSNGAFLVKEKFSALGWNENTTAEENTMAGVTRHEFTGHEGLDNVWLVNMNGRIYQPSGSMFLSPDPNIPNPGDTQSYNRYSYVNNNPLTYVDPSGFESTLPYNAKGERVGGADTFHGGIGGGGTIGNSVYGTDVTSTGGFSSGFGSGFGSSHGGNDGNDGNGTGDSGTGSGVSFTCKAGDICVAARRPPDGGGIHSPDFYRGLAQSQTFSSLPQATGPADYQIDTPITVASRAYQSSYLSSPALYNPNFFTGLGGTGCIGCGSSRGTAFVRTPTSQASTGLSTMGPGSAVVFGSGAIGSASGATVGFYFGAAAASEEAAALTTSSGLVYGFMGGSEALAGTTLAGGALGAGVGIVFGGAVYGLYYLSQLPADRPINPVYISPF
jgi:RHS repeat-associated protein